MEKCEKTLKVPESFIKWLKSENTEILGKSVLVKDDKLFSVLLNKLDKNHEISYQTFRRLIKDSV